MDIWGRIRELIKVVEHGIGSTKENEKAVIRLIGSISLNMHEINPTIDYEWLEIPDNDYSAIRKSAATRFPNWGYYNVLNDVTKKTLLPPKLQLVTPLMTLQISLKI